MPQTRQSKRRRHARAEPSVGEPSWRTFIPNFNTRPPLHIPTYFQPKKVVTRETQLGCPMPDCERVLQGTNEAWCWHFATVHHDAICISSECKDGKREGCQALCPKEDCKFASGVEETAAEVIGRHFFSEHTRLSWRCPMCGMQSPRGEEACRRHIRWCLESIGGNRPKRWYPGCD